MLASLWGSTAWPSNSFSVCCNPALGSGRQTCIVFMKGLLDIWIPVNSTNVEHQEGDKRVNVCKGGILFSQLPLIQVPSFCQRPHTAPTSHPSQGSTPSPWPSSKEMVTAPCSSGPEVLYYPLLVVLNTDYTFINCSFIKLPEAWCT